MQEPKRDSDLLKLHPLFRGKLEDMLNVAYWEWLHPYVFEWLRSKERQYFLFGKWRTANTLKKYGVPTIYANPSTKQVTWTLQSNHLEGKAADIVFDINKDPKVRTPSWNWNYKRLIEIAKDLWLRNLSPFELCHFEL